MPTSVMPAPLYRLALCFRDHPVTLNQIPAKPLLADRMEQRCHQPQRGHLQSQHGHLGAICIVDILHLRPERSLRSFIRPLPRTQHVVTTVWPDPESLYASLTEDGLLDEVRQTPHVLFWTPGVFIPGLADVEKRLARQETLGGSGLLGNLQQVPASPPEPSATLLHPDQSEIRMHEDRLHGDARLSALQYDRRLFNSMHNTDNGDVQPGLTFHYYESDGVVWAFYEGQGVELGTLAARKGPHGRLRMRYQHISNTDELREGECFSYPEILPDGRLRMHEFWRWTSGDASAGKSLLEEAPGVTIKRKIS